MKCIILQAPQHFSIPVLGGDEEPSASLTPAVMPPTEPAEAGQAQVAEAPKPVLAALLDPSSSVNEPFPNVVAALKEYKQKEEEGTQAGSSASSAASLPSAVADPAADAPAAAEVCSHIPSSHAEGVQQYTQFGTADTAAVEHRSEGLSYSGMSALAYLC